MLTQTDWQVAASGCDPTQFQPSLAQVSDDAGFAAATLSPSTSDPTASTPRNHPDTLLARFDIRPSWSILRLLTAFAWSTSDYGLAIVEVVLAAGDPPATPVRAVGLDCTAQ
jgi:hypothetical protein